MFDEKFKVVGEVTAKLYRDGRLVNEREMKNLVVSHGLMSILGPMLDSNVNDAPTVMSNKLSAIKVGSGQIAPSANNTSLEVLLATSTSVANQYEDGSSPTTSNDVLTKGIPVFAEFSGQASTMAITEAGLFMGDVLFSRIVFPVMTLGTNDRLQIFWNIKLVSA